MISGVFQSRLTTPFWLRLKSDSPRRVRGSNQSGTLDGEFENWSPAIDDEPVSMCDPTCRARNSSPCRRCPSASTCRLWIVGIGIVRGTVYVADVGVEHRAGQVVIARRPNVALWSRRRHHDVGIVSVVREMNSARANIRDGEGCSRRQRLLHIEVPVIGQAAGRIRIEIRDAFPGQSILRDRVRTA